MLHPSVPKGTRDFSSESVLKREYIIETIKKNFIIYGFEPLQTSSLENLSTLTGKYGEEGDQLIFKILNNGDYLKSIDEELLKEKNSKKLIPAISDKALRYDLTVPFARYVVQNQHQMTFPFKRFQIQPVWRADRPQKGRFREFYQCDADVVGSSSLWQEVELVLLYDVIFSDLNLSVELQLNNRKILSGLAEMAAIKDHLMDFTGALDKLDKIGAEKVKEEMRLKGISDEAIEKLSFVFKENTDNFLILNELEDLLKNSEVGKKGIEEVRFLLNQIKKHELKTTNIKYNLSLARGLNYYTGMIFEVKSNEVEMGSIGGGGRYDDLTGIFGLKNTSGIGISFGLDRIYLVLDELHLFPKLEENKLKILFLHLGIEEGKLAFSMTQQVRKNKINTAFYPEETKLKKQLQYADKKEIPFVAILGEKEMKNNEILLKNMKSGEQIICKNLNELIELVK